MTGSTTTNQADITSYLTVEQMIENLQEGETGQGSDSEMSPCYESEHSNADPLEFLQDGHLSPIQVDQANDKPSVSYIAIISMAIMSSPHKKMLLSEIYQWIAEKYPYFRSKERSWRNSVRHNLSLNECFVKSGRSHNSKGNYWSIHPANVEDFALGDFRRRRARRRVRNCEEMQRIRYGYPTTTNVPSESQVSGSNGYIPMMNSSMSVKVLAEMFGMENIMSKEEQLNYFCNTVNISVPSVDVSGTIPSMIPSLLSPVSPSSMTGSYSTTNSYSTSTYPGHPCSFKENNVSVTVSTVDVNNVSPMFPSPISVEDLAEWH